ncbi:hypothetical protein [Carnobacterium mobile]|uniref:hypothetical protein n=1 Tax=Carnobacterium mobile TaxID=2750 RepID=UPI000AF9B0CD|nr:hypothetical protein [Carnobacterium mobile]
MISTKSDRIIKHNLRVIQLILDDIYEKSDTQDMFVHNELEKIQESIKFLAEIFKKY